MSQVQSLLEKIRKEARARTLERISERGRDVNVLLFLLISEIYSIEVIIEELLTALEELNKKFGKK